MKPGQNFKIFLATPQFLKIFTDRKFFQFFHRIRKFLNNFSNSKFSKTFHLYMSQLEIGPGSGPGLFRGPEKGGGFLGRV